MANGNNKKSADQSAITNNVEHVIDMRYPWNNINKNVKRWASAHEQAFQAFRFAIFNKNGDLYMHPILFKMVVDLPLTGKLRPADANKIANYASRINDSNATEAVNLFTTDEQLDIKVRLSPYAAQYWRFLGMPGYTARTSKVNAIVATADDIKPNAGVDSFLNSL